MAIRNLAVIDKIGEGPWEGVLLEGLRESELRSAERRRENDRPVRLSGAVQA